MDFRDTPEEAAFREEVREFIKTEAPKLEAGADIRYVQELLGHEDIRTTVQYTRLQIDSIKRVYRMYHPRENAFYEEIDEKYLEDLEKLKQEILRRREINSKNRK